MTNFLCGAYPSPPHKLLAATPHRVLRTPVPQLAVIPSQLSVWKNDTYGDCVTAEEAFAKAWWSTYCGLPELFVPDAEVVRWATKYGFLNGANLTDPMDVMKTDGFTINGQNFKDGGYYGVDYSNELNLQSALDPSDNNGGPVKIAIDHSALPDTAGMQQGWYSTSGNKYTNTDHCVSIAGYGRADYLYGQLRVSLPSGLSPSTPGYLVFTWGTIGFVTHDWLMGTCVEAWVRNPTTPGEAPPTPTPIPTPPPTPTPTPTPPPTPTPVPVPVGYTKVFTATSNTPISGNITRWGRNMEIILVESQSPINVTVK